jgi:hypothetical protein
MINPISSTSTSTAALSQMDGTNGQAFRTRMQQTMDPVAKALGMSTDDLLGQLKSGTTLNDIASQQGVSHDKLISAIEDGLKSAPAAGSAAPSTNQLSQMAESIASGQRVGGHHHHHHHGGGGATSVPNTTDPSTTTATTSSTTDSTTIGSVIDTLG